MNDDDVFTSAPENRDGSGRFRPGESGNKGGRPRAVVSITKLAREHAPEAIHTLVELMRSDNDRTRVAAANAILDRGIGKPAQACEASDAQPASTLDLSKLSNEEVRTMHELIRKASRGPDDDTARDQSPAPASIFKRHA